MSEKTLEEKIREACHKWVETFSAFPQGMLEDVNKAHDYMEFTEVTPPSKYDRVYAFNEQEYGEITERNGDEFTIELDNGNVIKVESDNFEVERDGFFPMWGWLWQFGDGIDDEWIDGTFAEEGEPSGLQVLADCGFRIYESEEYGYFFGIDGAGYDFYEDHWIPLYKARGLQWHKYID